MWWVCVCERERGIRRGFREACQTKKKKNPTKIKIESRTNWSPGLGGISKIFCHLIYPCLFLRSHSIGFPPFSLSLFVSLVCAFLCVSSSKKIAGSTHGLVTWASLCIGMTNLALLCYYSPRGGSWDSSKGPTINKILKCASHNHTSPRLIDVSAACLADKRYHCLEG